MNFDKNVNFIFVDDNNEKLDSFSTSRCVYIPQIGAEFSFWCAKYISGDRSNTAKERFSGVVTEVKHSLSERVEPDSYALVEFVEVYVRKKTNEQN